MQISCDITFTQITANAGIKKFGESLIAVMIQEFTRFNKGAVSSKPVVIPTDASTLNDLENQKALPAVNLIQEKWNGDIKGRSYVDGSK